jgi:hypothetical protein
MRPGAIRAFSVTRRIAQQALFEPYVPSLNKEQEKAIRKAARALEPNYHGHMNKDAATVLGVRVPSLPRLYHGLTA